jgi:hypothetical protein
MTVMREVEEPIAVVLTASASSEAAADNEDIHPAWKRRGESHPVEGDEPDFPDVRSMRRS